MFLNACPVRSLTPWAEAMLGLFDVSHQITAGGHVALYAPIALPRPGGIGQQDHRTLVALAVLREEHNVMASEEITRRRKANEVRALEDADRHLDALEEGLDG